MLLSRGQRGRHPQGHNHTHYNYATGVETTDCQLIAHELLTDKNNLEQLSQLLRHFVVEVGIVGLCVCAATKTSFVEGFAATRQR